LTVCARSVSRRDQKPSSRVVSLGESLILDQFTFRALLTTVSSDHRRSSRPRWPCTRCSTNTSRTPSRTLRQPLHCRKHGLLGRPPTSRVYVRETLCVSCWTARRDSVWSTKKRRARVCSRCRSCSGHKDLGRLCGSWGHVDGQTRRRGACTCIPYIHYQKTCMRGPHGWTVEVLCK